MKKVIFIVLSVICLLFYGCNKEEITTPEEKIGKIFGRVTDFVSGKSIAGANVSLLPGGETTLTGNDGMYEFLNIEDGDYSIMVSKAEYTDLIDDFTIQVRDGNDIRYDLQIKKLQADISITDVYGNNLPFLDFGSDLYTTTKSFNIFNNGTINVNCSISYACNWIRTISSVPSTIKPGQNVTVSVEIDRSNLVAGNNVTMLYIASNNGNNVLEIRAVGEENLPSVITLPVTYPDGTLGPWMHVFHGNVVNAGYPPYIKKGFCWSTANSVPTIDDESTIVQGTGVGEYSYDAIRDIPIPSSRVTYYVRAWVMKRDNTIIYGNVQSFVYNDVKN